MSFLAEHLFPMGDWRWGITAVLFFVSAGIAWAWPWPWRKKDPLGPEIRLNEHSTYREIGDGWREVTTIRKTPPVRISGVGETSVGGSATLTVTRKGEETDDG